MPEPWQVLTFEAPIVALCGPEWSAVLAGFAILVAGRLYITPSGEHYLERLG
jgi:hypothetical protein